MIAAVALCSLPEQKAAAAAAAAAGALLQACEIYCMRTDQSLRLRLINDVISRSV